MAFTLIISQAQIFMNVISYFNLIANSKFSTESQELIDMWKKSWQQHGWNVVLLNESDSRKNPMFDKLDLDDPSANFYRTIDPRMQTYHRSCYCRLLAYCQYVRENGSTLYADYDVINYGFSPDILKSTPDDSHFCGTRCTVYLGDEGKDQIEKSILNFSDNSFKEGDDRGSCNDMNIVSKYTSCFKLKRDTNNQLYVSSIMPDFSNITPLVHYDGGCYKRGVSRDLTRVEIVKKYNQIVGCNM